MLLVGEEEEEEEEKCMKKPNKGKGEYWKYGEKNSCNWGELPFISDSSQPSRHGNNLVRLARNTLYFNFYGSAEGERILPYEKKIGFFFPPHRFGN